MRGVKGAFTRGGSVQTRNRLGLRVGTRDVHTQAKAGWGDVECGGHPRPRSILSPGGESHFPWVDVCVDTGLDPIREQKAQWAEAAVSRARLESSQSAEITVMQSSTRAKERPQLVKEEPQLVHEDPRPTPSREGPVSHTTEGQSRPDVRVATWGPGEPGPMGAGTWTPPPEPQPHRPHEPPTSKPLSPNRRRALFSLVRHCCGCRNLTRPEDPEPQEAEPEGEKVGGGGGMGGEVPVSLWGGIVARHTRSTPRAWPGADWPQTTHLLDVGREGVLCWVLGSGCVLCLGGIREFCHVGGLLSSHHSSTRPEARHGSSSNT